MNIKPGMVAVYNVECLPILQFNVYSCIPVGKSMSWYGKPWILVPLYSVPTLLLSILVVYMVQYIVSRFMQYIEDTKVHSRIIEVFISCIYMRIHGTGSKGQQILLLLKKSVNLKEMFMTWIQIRIHFFQCGSRIRIRIIINQH